VFRICNEVTFCFDGDRAGRAAAWKALENSLSQVREGRQIRFLFLPDGHDPDSLVGEEGREAFETRIKQAMPLSEYFINQLSAQVDIKSIDGRALLGEMARPLLERIPAGIFRELLADEVAKTVGLKSGRLTSLLGEGAETKPAAAEPARTARRPQLQAGRRNLVRQAIFLLVQYPEIADKVVLHPALATLERPGIGLLIELIEELARRPCANTGALLERWRERPDVEHLAKLAAQECLVDAAGAAQELAGAVRHLGDEAARLRTDFLLKKTERSDAEKAELQGLLARKPPVDLGA
jgi:DNA primase